ncbi:hypothetical protein MML48_1g21857 [Holotrichia oblita]|uniref:Uncharacterized protein n=1 Tax=Holotrichia oblita TaxID=644536 RepID=A0ACB9TXK5_HOLOL|nr:hypothetical protein MML48_1g21857 [Holotrichia oblita]
MQFYCKNGTRKERKTDRMNLDEVAMSQSIKDVFQKSKSKRNASQDYNLKRTSLQSRIKASLKEKSLEELLRKYDDPGNASEDKIDQIFSETNF